MGGKKAWQFNEEWHQAGHQAGQRPWRSRLWSGAWQASPKARAARPQYDQIRLPEPSQKTWQSEDSEEPSTGSELRREIQKALSNARKSDLKVRRLREERRVKEEQWRIFQKEAKEEFLKERKRFETALQRIEGEITTATKSGQEASLLVQNLAINGIGAKPGPVEDTKTEAWESLIADEEAHMEPGFLRDALLAAQQFHADPKGSGKGSGMVASGSLMTPEAAAMLLQMTMAHLPPGFPVVPGAAAGDSRTPGPYTSQPDASVEAGAQGSRAPFPTSPSQPKMDITPGGGGPPISPGTRSRPPTRQPVKGGPLQPVHTGSGTGANLAGKLERARQAMRPFGLPVDLAGETKQTDQKTEEVVMGSGTDVDSEPGRPKENGTALDGMG
eukprot:s474_g7.t1